MDYSEFTSTQNSSIQCGQIISSNINRANPTENKHSCTPGINNTLAMCIESKMDCTYNAGHERTVIFTLEITPNSDKHIRVNEIRFFEKSPLNYEWINGPSGLNNYPTKFGFRVLKNNIEVFKDENITSLRDWNERRFNFDNITGVL
ncbi:MAG: hypothetical protein IPN86_24115 [Saprospiraceae bacterium]|nr:hypothetical protein [Saprospiraceae bacterium]